MNREYAYHILMSDNLCDVNIHEIHILVFYHLVKQPFETGLNGKVGYG